MKSLSSSPSATTSNILLSPYKNNIDSLHEIPTSQFISPCVCQRDGQKTLQLLCIKANILYTLYNS